jgi:hypothetical protein
MRFLSVRKTLAEGYRYLLNCQTNYLQQRTLMRLILAVLSLTFFAFIPVEGVFRNSIDETVDSKTVSSNSDHRSESTGYRYGDVNGNRKKPYGSDSSV